MTEQQFADALDVSRGTVQQWEKADGTAPARKRQDSVAKLLGISVSELMHGTFPAEPLKVVEIGSIRNQKTKPDELVIPQFETGGSMGGGLLLRDQPGVIRGWTVNHEWIAKNIRAHSGAANLCIVTGFGDSMKGMFNSGDPLVIDRGIKTVEFDAVYFFRVADEGFFTPIEKYFALIDSFSCLDSFSIA